MSVPGGENDSVGPNRTRWVWGFVIFGILLRLAAYLWNFPLWWDEAFVAVNLLRRDYLGLLQPLDYGQVAPLAFLWAELANVRLLGFHEWSLRLFPLICSIGGLIGFKIIAGRILEPRAELLAVAIMAVAIHPIRHAADVKPYSADLLVAVVVIGLANEWLRQPDQRRWLWFLTAFSPVAFLLSHPSIFMVAGVLLALGLKAWRSQNLGVRISYIACALLSGSIYLGIYVGFTARQASSASLGMAEMWIRSFPPLDSLPRFIAWMVVAHSGDLMAYPCGGERGGSTLSLVCCLVGIFELVRRHASALLLVLVGPLMLAIMGASLRLYPYGGPAPHGSAARIMQYAAPSLCLLIGLGASRLFELAPTDRQRMRLFRWVCLILVGIGLVPQVASFVRPYRAYQAEAARSFAREFWPRIGRDAEVACLRWDFPVGAWDSIHLGVAVSLCDQAIASPSRWSGGPRLDRVSASHPLRCVLGVAPETDSPALTTWLEQMRQTYELRKRETYRVRISEPGRREEYERYEVFEFIPGPIAETRLTPDRQAVKGL